MRLDENNNLPKRIPVDKSKDLTGQQFGKLIVKYRCEYPEGVPHTTAYWVAQCDCGNYTRVRSDHLRDNKIKSCGGAECCNAAEDLIGKTFNRLVQLKIE